MKSSLIRNHITPKLPTLLKKTVHVNPFPWTLLEAVLIGKGDVLSEEVVKAEVMKIIKDKSIEEITFTHAGENASDSVILSSSREDLLETIISAFYDKKLDCAEAIHRRYCRNNAYIKERQLFADITNDRGVLPSEFAVDVYDFLIDLEIRVFSTIKYFNKSRQSWSCIIQLKDVADVIKVKSQFPDNMINLNNGEKLKITSCGSYIPQSYNEVVCPASDVKGFFSKLDKLIPARYGITQQNMIIKDKLAIITCKSLRRFKFDQRNHTNTSSSSS